MGALGIVTEVTLQCVPAHKLLEHTYVLSRAEVTRDPLPCPAAMCSLLARRAAWRVALGEWLRCMEGCIR